MHVLLALVTIFAVWKWGDWRHWEKYHTTMLFFAFGNLMYNFIAANHLLWQMTPKLLPNQTIVELLYTLLIFPGTALLYLTNYPTKVMKVVLYNLKWMAIYIVIEWIGLKTGYITYNYDWNLWWSLAFVVLMFPLLRLHYKKSLLAYVFSFALGLFIVVYFDIHVPR